MRSSNLTFLSIIVSTLLFSLSSNAQSPSETEFHLKIFNNETEKYCDFLEFKNGVAICHENDKSRIYLVSTLEEVTVIHNGQTFNVTEINEVKFNKLAVAVNRINNEKLIFEKRLNNQKNQSLDDLIDEPERRLLSGDRTAQSNMVTRGKVKKTALQGRIKSTISNNNTAPAWFFQQGNTEDADAQYELAAKYYTGDGVAQNYREAFKYASKAAHLGHVDAQYELATMYYKGEGVAQNYKEAFKWYSNVAQQGQARAQYVMGAMFYFGYGVTQDFKEALKWYSKAAYQGDVNAQYFLGAMYENGDWVAKDYKEALKWYEKAAQQGHEKAIGILEKNHLQNEQGENYNVDASDKCHEIMTEAKKHFMRDVYNEYNTSDHMKLISIITTYLNNEQKRCINKLSGVRDKEAIAHVLTEVYKGIASRAPGLESKCLTFSMCYADDFVGYDNNECLELLSKCRDLQHDRVMSHKGFHSF